MSHHKRTAPAESATVGAATGRPGGEERDRRNAQDRVPPPHTAEQRRAHVAALCGLMLARNRRYAAAEERFVEATTHDPDFDLTALEGFWMLPRGAQDAAVRAYERVGRVRDAAALAAWLRWTFRPRVLPGLESPTPSS